MRACEQRVGRSAGTNHQLGEKKSTAQQNEKKKKQRELKESLYFSVTNTEYTKRHPQESVAVVVVRAGRVEQREEVRPLQNAGAKEPSTLVVRETSSASLRTRGAVFCVGNQRQNQSTERDSAFLHLTTNTRAESISSFAKSAHRNPTQAAIQDGRQWWSFFSSLFACDGAFDPRHPASGDALSKGTAASLRASRRAHVAPSGAHASPRVAQRGSLTRALLYFFFVSSNGRCGRLWSMCVVARRVGGSRPEKERRRAGSSSFLQ